MQNWWQGWICNEGNYQDDYAPHIRTTFQIRVLVKMVNLMSMGKLDMTNSIFSLVIIHILGLLIKLKMFHCSIYKNLCVLKPCFTIFTLGCLIQEDS